MKATIEFSLIFIFSLIISNIVLGQTYATLPLTDNFTTMGSYWNSSANNSHGKVELRNWSGAWPQLGTTTDASGTATAGNGLAFYNDSTQTTVNKINAFLGLNLASKTGVSLKFSIMDWGSGVNLDSLKIYISTNGGSSYGSTFSLVNLNQSPYDDGYWNNVSINLSSLATSNSLTLSSTTVIKMQINLKGKITAANITKPKNGTQFIYMDNLYVSATGTLPVELTYFMGVKQNEDALLTWQTASEINNDYFVVQRSTDGINFEDLEVVSGFGNTNNISDYKYLDENAVDGNNYYRLKQVDFDGTFTYSLIISVSFDVEQQIINVFPNPSNGNFTVEITSVKSGTLRIYNLIGELVYQQEIDNNINLLNVSLEHLAKGNYFVQIINNALSTKQLKTEKIIIQ